jgi:hypothetical protein
MYDFAVVVFLGLAALKLSDLLVGFVPQLARFETLLRFVVAIAGVVAVDYSMFSGFDVTLRESWMGVWATGLIVGSLASVWNAALGYLGAREHTAVDPATQERPRIAA